MNYTYSKHAVERFVERFPELQTPGISPKVRLHQVFQGASHERGFLNDTRRVVWMLEKYGDFDYDFYVKGDVVFLCRQEVVITLINRRDKPMQKLFGYTEQSRFRKKNPAFA